MKKVLQKIQNEPATFLILKMFAFLGKDTRAMLFVIVAFAIATATALMEPLIFSKVINELQNNGIQSTNIFLLIGLLFASMVIGWAFWLFWAPARLVQQKLAFGVNENYKNSLLKSVLALDLTWHSEHESGDTIDKINKASEALLGFVQHQLQNVVYTLVRLIGTTILLFLFSPKIAVAAIIATLLILTLLFRFDKKLIPQYKQLNLFQNKISAQIIDALTNITSIIILGVKRSVHKNIAHTIHRPFNLYLRNNYINEMKWVTGDILFHSLIFIPIMFYMYGVYSHGETIQIGTIIALHMYLGRLTEVFYTFTGQYADLIKKKANIENAEEIESYIKSTKTKKKKIGTWQTLNIQNLYFSYHKKNKREKHLNNINFSIVQGEKIACIGDSGSGKTTFLKVIHGLYANAYAKIAKDETKTLKVDFANIDLNTMLVPQEPEIFSTTIRENITLGTTHKKEEIDHFVKMAHFDEVLKTLPKGLKSIINEKGVNLSGGQRQRLALTRALLFAKNKEIILLDESTSSVDPENEVKIYQNIFKHFKGKTIIASIHKMNLLKYFDRIIIFKNGEIISDGTFEQLLKSNVRFKQTWTEYTKSHKR